MGRIGRLVSFERRTRKGSKLSDAKLLVDAGNNITSEHFSGAGDDSFPLLDDYAITVPIPRSGGEVVAGYLDPKNLQKSVAGEKRIYSRSSDGNQASEIWLKNTGAIRAENGQGYYELQPSGEVLVNGARITTDGDFVTSDGVSLRNHYHHQNNDSDGNVQQPTNIPTPTE